MFRSRRNQQNHQIDETVEQAHQAGLQSGSMFATIISALALLFSGYSFYETALRAPSFAIYVPPRIDYTDPNSPDHPFEVFVLPLTIANDGARTGTVLSIDLTVTNPRTKQSKHFYAAQLGPWGQQPREPFAPVALSSKSSFSKAVQFIPRAEEKIGRILDLEAGNYEFEVKLHTATTGGDIPYLKAKVKPLHFEMQIAQLNYFNFNKSGTMPMWSKSYLPARTEGE
jgi:hypothetical protein